LADARTRLLEEGGLFHVGGPGFGRSPLAVAEVKDPASFVNKGRTGAVNIGQVDHHLSSAAFITAVCSWFTDVYWVFSPSSTAKDRKTCLGSFKALSHFVSGSR